ncbi:hypothetical protein [Streptomyces sp. LS1784]|uniref:hypothetical protein n=1 Tax=Streptomyces sp. LS1784 TaxID=2851533 RepID=UPI001CCA2182|nr:hypothetical protein [Streptomyces sp. LS1784]
MIFRAIAAAAILTFCVTIVSSAPARAAEPGMPIWTAPVAESLPIWPTSGQ